MSISPKRQETVALLVALFVVAVLNVPFWRALLAAVEPTDAYEWGFIAAAFVAVAAAFNLILTLLGPPRLMKAVVVPLLAVTAAASYYMSEYGVVIDHHMIANIFETNTAEATDLVTQKLILYVLGLGVLPAWILWRTPIVARSRNVDFWARAKVALASAVVFAGASVPFTMDFMSVVREHGELKHTLTPLNYISATAHYLGKHHRAEAAAVAPYGADAVRVPATARDNPKSVTIIVIGETARADHFSLNGYARETNPQLAKVPGLLNFDQVQSCGTDTAQSLPCMFSGVGRANFSSDIALRQEGLLDVLQRAGVGVLWRENQAGCKGVCARVPTETLTDSKLPEFCGEGECHDTILLDGLEAKIAALDRDGVIVLHMMGSHGPAYSKRHPKMFEFFTPACRESQFSRCANQEIVNAYDNTIRYTDHVLAQLIELLARIETRGIATSMIYVSDHGESLGENNLYLHGMPYALAPKAQKHVPMVVWLSEAAKASTGISGACLGGHAHDPLSHDNLFHSVLGLAGVESKVYDKSLDIFATCRSAAAVHAGRVVPGRSSQ